MYIVIEPKSYTVPESIGLDPQDIVPSYVHSYLECHKFEDIKSLTQYVLSVPNDDRLKLTIFSGSEISWELGINWKAATPTEE